MGSFSVAPNTRTTGTKMSSVHPNPNGNGFKIIQLPKKKPCAKIVHQKCVKHIGAGDKNHVLQHIDEAKKNHILQDISDGKKNHILCFARHENVTVIDYSLENIGHTAKNISRNGQYFVENENFTPEFPSAMMQTADQMRDISSIFRRNDAFSCRVLQLFQKQPTAKHTANVGSKRSRRGSYQNTIPNLSYQNISADPKTVIKQENFNTHKNVGLFLREWNDIVLQIQTHGLATHETNISNGRMIEDYFMNREKYELSASDVSYFSIHVCLTKPNNILLHISWSFHILNYSLYSIFIILKHSISFAIDILMLTLIKFFYYFSFSKGKYSFSNYKSLYSRRDFSIPTGSLLSEYSKEHAPISSLNTKTVTDLAKLAHMTEECPTTNPNLCLDTISDQAFNHTTKHCPTGNRNGMTETPKCKSPEESCNLSTTQQYPDKSLHLKTISHTVTSTEENFNSGTHLSQKDSLKLEKIFQNTTPSEESLISKTQTFRKADSEVKKARSQEKLISKTQTFRKSNSEASTRTPRRSNSSVLLRMLLPLLTFSALASVGSARVTECPFNKMCTCRYCHSQ